MDDRARETDTVSAASHVDRLSILGCRVDRVDQRQALQLLSAFCGEDWPHLVVTADSSMLVRAQHDLLLRKILDSAALVVPDSIGVVLASRILGCSLTERVTGVELVDRLCAVCARSGYTVFLLGAAPGVAERAALGLVRRYPGLKVVGTQHGFFGAAEEVDLLERIRSVKPHVLFVAMGIPRQEKWLYEHMPSLPVRLGMGVGGSLDVMAGTVKRAPEFFRRTNLEWLYRVLSDPRRFRKGLLLPAFVLLTIQYRMRQRTGGNPPASR